MRCRPCEVLTFHQTYNVTSALYQSSFPCQIYCTVWIHTSDIVFIQFQKQVKHNPESLFKGWETFLFWRAILIDIITLISQQCYTGWESMGHSPYGAHPGCPKAGLAGILWKDPGEEQGSKPQSSGVWTNLWTVKWHIYLPSLKCIGKARLNRPHISIWKFNSFYYTYKECICVMPKKYHFWSNLTFFFTF